jgi:hypothetical protein
MSLLAFAAAAAVLAAPPTPAEAVVRDLYGQVVKRKPLGIPGGEDRKAIWPLLTPRLRTLLETSDACEDDYARQHPGSDEKPEYAWLELGLFSGGNEQATPATATVVGAMPAGAGRHAVRVRFTYDDAPAGGGKPTTYTWEGTATVACDGSGCLVDDFAPDPDRGTPVPPLSATFTGCDGKRWVGERR